MKKRSTRYFLSTFIETERSPALFVSNKKSAKRKSLGEGRWRTCEEASVATAGSKRPELMARQKKTVKRIL